MTAEGRRAGGTLEGASREPSSLSMLCNHTPWRIVLTTRQGLPFELAPFERRPLGDDLAPEGYALLEARRMVSVQRRHDRPTWTAAIGLLTVALLIGALWAVVSLSFRQPHWLLELGLYVVTFIYVAAVVYVGVRAGWRRRRLLRVQGGTDTDWLGRAIRAVAVAAYEAAPMVLRALLLVLTVGMALVMAIVVPALIVYYGAGVNAEIGLRASPWPFTGHVDGYVVGRMLQLAVIVFAAFLPTLMYLQFDRTRRDTLRERWKRQLFRLDPSIATEADLWAKYGTQMDDATGRGGGFFARLNPSRHSPIVVATVVLSLGWTLVMVNPNTRSFDFLQALNPNLSPISVAFLGAYFFAIQLTVRGYVRGDLQPKSFSVITTRVVIAVILTWVVQLLLTGTVEAGPVTGATSKIVYALAFTAGVLPDFVLRYILDAVPNIGGTRPPAGSAFAELDGLDIYDRTRLSQEGVTNVEALAHHGLVDLMLRTRIPMARLVDWVDQAILAIHLGATAGTSAPAPAPAGAPGAVGSSDGITVLRAAGVRTATDLIGIVDDPEQATQLQALIHDAGGVGPRIPIIAAALRSEEWLSALLNWHTSPLADPEQVRLCWIDTQCRLNCASPPIVDKSAVPLDVSTLDVPGRAAGDADRMNGQVAAAT
jgi:hypothetical protein